MIRGHPLHPEIPVAGFFLVAIKFTFSIDGGWVFWIPLGPLTVIFMSHLMYEFTDKFLGVRIVDWFAARSPSDSDRD